MSGNRETRPHAAGDGDAVSRRFRTPLLSYFYKRVQNRSEAEDLTQETFLRLATHPDRRDGTAIHAYVFTIAANLLRDRARVRQYRREISLSPQDDETVSHLASLVEDRTPERVLLGKAALREVVGALAELSEQTRDIFILSRLERLPQREIAALYGISVSAVEKHVIKALSHLGARNLRS